MYIFYLCAKHLYFHDFIFLEQKPNITYIRLLEIKALLQGKEKLLQVTREHLGIIRLLN